MPRRVTDADYQTLRTLHAAGLARNEIARRMGRSGQTISAMCGKLDPPLRFERDATKLATEARKTDAAARRAALQVDMLAGAQKLLTQMFSPTKIYNFSGRDNSYNERQVDEPPFRDKRDLAAAIQALVAQSVRLAELDAGGNVEGAISLLDRVLTGLRTKHGTGEPADTGDGDIPPADA